MSRSSPPALRPNLPEHLPLAHTLTADIRLALDPFAAIPRYPVGPLAHCLCSLPPGLPRRFCGWCTVVCVACVGLQPTTPQCALYMAPARVLLALVSVCNVLDHHSPGPFSPFSGYGPAPARFAGYF